jgi:hypothetical protein
MLAAGVRSPVTVSGRSRLLVGLSRYSDALFRHVLSFLDPQSSGKVVGGAYVLFVLARVCSSLRDWAQSRLSRLECLDLSFGSVGAMLSNQELESCLRFVLSRLPLRLSVISIHRQFHARLSTIRLVLLADPWFPLPWQFDLRATVYRMPMGFITALLLQGPATLKVRILWVILTLFCSCLPSVSSTMLRTTTSSTRPISMRPVCFALRYKLVLLTLTARCMAVKSGPVPCVHDGLHLWAMRSRSMARIYACCADGVLAATSVEAAIRWRLGWACLSRYSPALRHLVASASTTARCVSSA